MSRRTFVWSVVGITLAGLLLRLPRLAWQPLWWDEGYSVYFATEPLARMAWLTARDIHPPLYYALLHLWTAMLGRTDPVTLRAFSVAWGVLALPLMVWLARTCFPGRLRVALLAGLLLALNPMQIYYSQEVRMYGMAMALMVAATALFWRLLARPTWRRAAAYAIAALLALYTLYYSALVLAAHFVWGLWRSRRDRARIITLLSTGFVIALGYLPWIAYAGPKLAPYVSNKVASDGDSPLNLPLYLWRHGQTFLAGHIAPQVGAAGEMGLVNQILTGVGLLGSLGLLLLLIGLATRRHIAPDADKAAAWLDERAAVTALATFTLLPVTLAFLLNLRLPFFPEGGERLLLSVLPFALLLISATIGRTWRPPPWGKLALTAFLLSAGAGIVTLYATPRYITRDYRPLIGQIVQQGGPDDTVLAIFPWQLGYWRAYVPADFRQTFGPEARLAAEGILAWGTEIQAAVDDALTKGTLWFPEPLAFGSTLPGEIEEYLTPRSANLVNRWYSSDTRLTAWNSLASAEGMPVLAPVDAAFGPATLVAAAVTPRRAVSANQPVAVTLEWRLASGSRAADYYVTLRLFDAEGRQWSARDYAPLGGLALSGEEGLMEQAGLTVPAGLPPGQYLLAVGLGEQATDALLRPSTLNADVPPFQPLATLEITQPDEALPVERLPIQFPLARPVVDSGLAILGHAGATDADATLAGTQLAVRLFFQNQAAEAPPRHLYVSLRGDDNRVVTEWEGWPLPDYPTESWPAGALVQMPVTLFVPPTVNTGEYALIARLVDPLGGEDGPTAELGAVRIRQRVGAFDTPAMQVTLPNPVRFGTHADLIGYDLTQSDDALAVTLHWNIQQPLLPPHHIFVHLDEAGDAIVTLAQADGAPRNAAGPAPTGSWLPGEYLSTQHTITLPAELATQLVAEPDEFLLRVGLYNPEGNVRLPATVNGAPAGDAAGLGVDSPH